MSRTAVFIRNIALIAVLGSFVFFFGQPRGARGTASGGPNVVATVNGESIPRDLFEFMREQNQEAFRQSNQEGADPQKLAEAIDQTTRGSLVRLYLTAQEAQALGLRISEQAVIEDFQRAPMFQSDGHFDRELAERFINRTGLGQNGYKELHRRILLDRDFMRYVSSPVRVSDGEVRDEILRAETKVTLRVATASKAALREHISVTPEEVKSLLAREPERVKGAYQTHIADYTREEQIHARHMLFTGDDAEALAIQARARVLAGESFADVAKQVSADAATRSEGGDLGTFPRGRMMPAFDEAAFSLEPGKISGPVKTDRGVHLILVESHQAASQTPYQAVQEKLAEGLLREDKASEEARNATNRVLDAVKAGTPFAKAAAAQNLPVTVTAPFGFRESFVPGLAGVAELHDVALALTPEQPVPQRVFSDADALYVVELQTRDVPSEEKLAGEMSAMRERLLQRQRDVTAQLWLGKRLDELKAAGKLEQYPLYPDRGRATE